MNARMRGWLIGLTVALVATIVAPVTAKDTFKLLTAVPDDVFLCVAGQNNPERDFLDAYWSEVIDALNKSGIGSDLMELIGSNLGEEERAEVDRLKARVSQLIEGISWKALVGGQVVFAERLGRPSRTGDNIAMGPPDMMWAARGSEGSTPKNYDGLVGILQAVVDEVNKAAGKEVLAIDTTPRSGAKVASVNLTKSVPGAPPYSVAVAFREDVILITLGNEMLPDVLGLLEGKSSKKAITASQRFQDAFAKLPAAEDSMVFFDVQAMLKTFRALADQAVTAMKVETKDVTPELPADPKVQELHAKSVQASQQKDQKQAIEYAKQELAAAPNYATAMYNLACFNALLGNQNEALSWLEKAVDGGFYAPGQISGDEDLASLRGDSRYEAALTRAKTKATSQPQPGGEAAMVEALAKRLLDVPGMFDYVAAVESTDGYSVRTEKVTALTAGASEKPFYPVFGKRAPLTTFDRYLPQETVSFSICGGIDFGELYKFIEDTIRGIGPQGEAMLAQWAGIQQQAGIDVRKDIIGLLEGSVLSADIKGPAGDAALLMVKVNDETAAREKLAKALESLAPMVQQVAAQQPMLAMLAPRVAPTTHEKLQGFHDIAFAMSPRPLVLGVADGYFIFGSNADTVALCLATAKGEHPSVKKNEQLMAEALVPKGPFSSVSFTDKRNLGSEISQLLGGLSMGGGMAAMAVPDPKAQQAIMKLCGMLAKLGPVVQRLDFYKSTAGYTTFDGKGWYTRGVTNYRSPAERPARTQTPTPGATP